MPNVQTSPIGSRDTLDVARVNTANTDSSGATATGVVDVKTAGSNGSWVSSVDVNAEGTTTSGAVYFFLYDGTNRTPIGLAVLVPAITVSDTAVPFQTTWIPPNSPLRIPTGWKLQAATRKAEAFRLTCKGGDN